MKKLRLPDRRASSSASFDFGSLGDVLFESADLLEEARDSDDADFRAASIELAIRSLYAASAAIDRYLAPYRRPGVIVPGPWNPPAPEA